MLTWTHQSCWGKKKTTQNNNDGKLLNSTNTFLLLGVLLHASVELLLTLPALICPADKWPPAALCTCVCVRMWWCVRASLLCPKWGDKGGAESLMSSLTGRIHVSLFLPANTCCSGRGKIQPTLHATHTNGRMRRSEKERKGVYQAQEDMSGGHSALVAFERNAATIIRVNLRMLISSVCRFTGGKYKGASWSGENVKLKTVLNLYWWVGLVLILRVWFEGIDMIRNGVVRYDTIWFHRILYNTIHFIVLMGEILSDCQEWGQGQYFMWLFLMTRIQVIWYGWMNHSHIQPLIISEWHQRVHLCL